MSEYHVSFWLAQSEGREESLFCFIAMPVLILDVVIMHLFYFILLNEMAIIYTLLQTPTLQLTDALN